jgi:hypothetical protein
MLAEIVNDRRNAHYKPSPAGAPSSLRSSNPKPIPAPKEIGMKILDPFLPSKIPAPFFGYAAFLTLPMLEKYEVVVVEDPENLIHW